MRKSYLIITFLVGIILIGTVLALYFFSNSKLLSPSDNKGLESCNDLYYNSENAVNVVIFADNVTAKRYADSLLNTKPYIDNKDKFNFYFIDNYAPECTFYKGIALFCYSKDLLKKAGSCPNDYVVVIQKNDSKIRSSSYMNVLSLNAVSPLTVIAHEFAHSFAVLDEEYIPGAISGDSKNCKLSCDEFGMEGCYQGCSENSYYRQYNSGIMRTLYSERYGEFDEQVIGSEISYREPSFITGNVIQEQVNCSDQRYYLIEGNYSNGHVVFLNKSLEYGCGGGNGKGKNLFYSIYDGQGSVIINSTFNPGVIFTDVQLPGDESITGEVYQDQNQFLLRVPVISACKTLKLLYNGTVIAETIVNDGDARPCRI